MKIQFETIILRFDKKGEKSGWTYISVDSHMINKLKRDQRKSFRVKGKLDKVLINQQALIPMGDGSFIMSLNANLRKKLGKKNGAKIYVELELDHSEIQQDPDLLFCLEDVPSAKKQFMSLSKSHQNYFSNWIASAKTSATKTKRIIRCIDAMEKKLNFSEMLHLNVRS